MTYTDSQIKNAKVAYSKFLKIETLHDYDVATIGMVVAEQRMEYNNKIVRAILAGDKGLERQWKSFFLNQEVKSDRESEARKAKLSSNKELSADVLAPIKSAKRIVEFGKWLNTSGNKFRKEHFSKKYSHESVNTFLSL
jgi:hypothetical protein